MKVKALLNLLSAGQYVEFNYIDNDGYITAYSIPLYQHSEHSLGDINIYPFLYREIDEIYTNIERDVYDEGVDYLCVVLKREKD